MTNNTDALSDLILEEVLSIWKDSDPVECYAAGFDECKGKLFMPTDAAKADILRRIENARSRLTDIQDPILQLTANKLLSSISVGVTFNTPDEQILACFIAIWYSILKKQQKEAFVGELLEQAVELVASEHSRWQGQVFTGVTRKACVDACSSLEAILILLAGENPGLVGAISDLSATVANFRSLFSFPVRQSDSFEDLLTFFAENSGPAAENKLYPQMIIHLFDYGASVEDIYAQSQELLAEELSLAKEVASKMSTAINLPQGASLGDAYEAVSKRYEISGDVVAEATKMMDVLNRFVDGNIEDIGVNPNILPEATPAFLKPLITSGTAIALNYMRDEPEVHIYVTEEKNTSWLTLLNVLVHEATHAYNPLILAAPPSVPKLLKLKSWLALPFYEATAFHRELELFEAIEAGERSQPGGNETLAELLRLFDTPVFPLRDDVLAFEFETRIWRIIRALRTICDVEINTGKRTYVEFLSSAVAQTGLKKELIHNECFTFLSYPGYTPSYSFCGSQYRELQKEAQKRKVDRLTFNTKANRMGLLPWTLCVKQMREFRPE